MLLRRMPRHSYYCVVAVVIFAVVVGLVSTTAAAPPLQPPPSPPVDLCSADSTSTQLSWCQRRNPLLTYLPWADDLGDEFYCDGSG